MNERSRRETERNPRESEERVFKNTRFQDLIVRLVRGMVVMIVVGERGWCPRPFLVWSFQAPTKEGKERKERKKKIDDAENAESTEVSSFSVVVRRYIHGLSFS